MIFRRGRSLRVESDPEQVFKQVREVEAKLRKSLAVFREYLEELEAEIHQPRDEEV